MSAGQSCEFCGALPVDQIETNGWLPVDTMPAGKWVYVFVPGAGPGFAAIKRHKGPFLPGVIVGLSTGKIIHQATHWRPCWLPPIESMISDKNLYCGDAA